MSIFNFKKALEKLKLVANKKSLVHFFSIDDENTSHLIMQMRIKNEN